MTSCRHDSDLGAFAGTAVVAALAAKGQALWSVPAAGWFAWLWLPWDDLAIGLLLALVLLRVPRWLARLLLVAVVAYAAVNVLFVRALGTPFVLSMLRGMDAAMGDCAAAYLSATNAACFLLVVGAAIVGARVGRRVAPSARQVGCGFLIAAALWMVVPAPGHVAHRNALTALVRSLLPRTLPAATGPVLVASLANEAAPLACFAGAARGRSVVYVVLESAAARFVNVADVALQPMPFLAGLAANGLVCRNAYAVFPESIEGQVPILCALPPMPDAEPGEYASHARHSLPARLRPHGYTSGLFHAGRFRFLGMQDVLGPMGFDVLADAATIGGDRESSFGIDEEATVDALLHWVDGLSQGQRFLACYLPIAGHHPYASPAGGPFATETQLGCYRNALHYADRSLRRLWQGLCARRRAEDLLLCVVGDHGEAFGEHPGNFGHSFELYEENLRVPLVFHAPGSALAGVTGDAVCSHLEVVPTLLDLLGLHDGPSLLRRSTSGGRVYAFTDWGELLVALRDGDWKFIHEVQTGRDRLFDLVVDPGERENVAAQHGELTKRLRADALEFLGRTRVASSR